VKKVAILQSNYIPWKGYFDMIASVDEFILYDDMQFTRRDWRNRNQIKTAQGLTWLTIPVMNKGNYSELIKNIRVSDHSWADSHWKSIRLSHSRSPHFDVFAQKIESLYSRAASIQLLSEVNHLFLSELCSLLSIETALTWSMNYNVEGGKSERLINICRQAGATHYLSGPAAKNYLDEIAFEQAGISVEWMDYSSYAPYPQLFGDFVHGVSVIDVLFNCGHKAADFIWKRGA